MAGVAAPIENGYITISQIAGERTAIGTIAVGGAQFTVYVVDKPWPEKP